MFDVHSDNKPQSWWVKGMASQLPGVVVNLAIQRNNNNDSSAQYMTVRRWLVIN